MRNIIDVLDIMIAYTPISSEEADEFSNDLKRLRNSAAYTAPEAMGYCWEQGAQILAWHFGDYPKERWQKRTCSIWLDKPMETIFSKQEWRRND